METTEKVRSAFEAWAVLQNYNLERHPNNKDFYFDRNVSELWVCWVTAFQAGFSDAAGEVHKFIYDEE